MKSGSDLMPTTTILLVDDEKTTLELLATIIAMKYPGAALHTATCGKTGLELFKMHTPDIVITDINMPEMNGVQLADEIRTINPDTKLIALTGNTGKLLLHDSDEKEFEFDHTIVKPVSFQELFAVTDLCIAEIKQPAS